MDHSRLGAVVDSLQLRNVDDAAAHGRRRNEASGRVVLERLAVNRRALFFLAAEVGAGALRTPHDAVHVDGHDIAGHVGRAVNEGALGPWDARVGDKDVEAAVELLDNLRDGLVDGLGRGNVYLVCLACDLNQSLASQVSTMANRWKWEARTLDAVRLGNGGSRLLGLLVAVIPDRNVGAGLCKSLDDGETDASTGA